MQFKEISIIDWNQFKSVSIDFHDRLTVITGANGSGKTTLLNILAKHHQWEMPSLATPKKHKKSGGYTYVTRNQKKLDDENNNVIGTLIYDEQNKTDIVVPDPGAANYSITLPTMREIKCFFVPAHRSVYRYQQVASILTARKTKASAFEEVSANIRSTFLGGRGQASSTMMKNTLLGWMVQGFGVTDPETGREIMPRDHELAGYFKGFEKVLQLILPQSLRFQEIEIRNYEVVFVCNNGEDEFILEAASGGICSLIDLCWQIYMLSTKDHEKFTVLIDEAENHLHPTMQRRLLPDLLNAFPEVTFIVTTHSPLIVGSVRDSNVYVLKYNENNKVESAKLDFRGQARSAADVLDEVLGVSFTMPMWAETELNKIVAKYAKIDAASLDFNELRLELEEMGLEALMPKTIENLLGTSDDKTG